MAIDVLERDDLPFPRSLRFNRRFYPFNAFRSLLGIAGDVTAPTYAELYAAKSRPTRSSRLGS